MTPDPNAALAFLKALRDLCEQYGATLSAEGGGIDCDVRGVGYEGLEVDAAGLTCWPSGQMNVNPDARAIRLDFGSVHREE